MEDEVVEVLWVARYDYNADWKLNNHKHDYYQIIYFIEGSGEIYLNGRKYFIGDELLLLVTPEEQHGLIASKSTVVKTLDLKFLVKDEHLKKEISLLSGISQTENSEIKTLLLKIKEEGTEKRDYYKAMSNMYLHQILLILLRCKNPTKEIKSPNIENEISSDNYNNVISKVQEFVERYYSQPLSLEVLSESLGYNKSYICQRFKADLKCTPMHYIYFLRITKAKELITYSDYSLKQIAAMTGFESIHHFTRIFHKYEGITPGKCREEVRGGIRKDIYLNEDFKNIDLTDKGKKEGLSQNRK